MIKANSCAAMFEVGGLFGMLAAGWLSDKLTKGRRGPMNVIFSLGMALSVLWIWLYPGYNPVIDGAALFLVGFFLFGPQMLIGLAAAELSHKKAAGTASGFAGWFAYFGAAAAGYPLGKVATVYGWSGYFMLLIGCGALTVLLFIPMWRVKGAMHVKDDENTPTNS